jgi:hypothetical protein
MPEPVNPDIESLKEFRNNDYLNLIWFLIQNIPSL